VELGRKIEFGIGNSEGGMLTSRCSIGRDDGAACMGNVECGMRNEEFKRVGTEPEVVLRPAMRSADFLSE
jgi:hypothetical protein